LRHGSTSSSRKADREASEAAGKTSEAPANIGFKAGVDAKNPVLVITSVG